MAIDLEVESTPTEVSEVDPVVRLFLSFLAREMTSHPQRMEAIDASLIQQIHALVGPIEIDLDKALSSEDE